MHAASPHRLHGNPVASLSEAQRVRRQRASLHRLRHTELQLALLVAAPAVQSSILRQCQRVVFSAAHGRDNDTAREGDLRRLVLLLHVRAPAENSLAVAVGAPAIHAARLREHDDVAGARRHLLDRVVSRELTSVHRQRRQLVAIAALQ